MAYIGASPTSVAFLTDYFSGNNSTTAFTMSVAPSTPSAVLVSISGVLQDPSAYSVSGTTLTFSSAPPSGSSNIVARYMGIPASGVTTTAYRTVTEYTATAGQTTFSPPSYTAGYINVYRNGVRLGAADYTASNGTTVVLGTGATLGDLITLESFYVSSVLNAMPTIGGTINAPSGSTPLVVQSNGSPVLAVGTTKVGIGTNAPSYALHVSGAAADGYRTALFETASTAGPAVQIKGSKIYELRSTNTGAGEGAGLFFIYDKDNEASRLTIGSGGVQAIRFDPTQTASSDANTLDDYEEGTWTPNVYNNGYSSTWTVKVGRYTKIGNLVTCWFNCDGGNSGTTGGALILTGLPFADIGNGNWQAVGFATTSGSASEPIMMQGSGGSVMQIWTTGGAQDLNQRTYVSGMFTYRS